MLREREREEMSFGEKRKIWIGLNYDTHYNLLRKRVRSDDTCVYIHTYIHACTSHNTYILLYPCTCSVTQQALLFANLHIDETLELIGDFFLGFFFFFTWIIRIKIFFARRKKVFDNFHSKGLFDLRINYEVKWVYSSLLLRINFVDGTGTTDWEFT